MKMVPKSSAFLAVIIERSFFLVFQVTSRISILQKGPLRLETLDGFVPLGHNEKILRIGISEIRKSVLSVNIALRCEQFFSDYPGYLVECSELLLTK